MGSLGFRVGPHLPLRLRLLTCTGCTLRTQAPPCKWHGNCLQIALEIGTILHRKPVTFCNFQCTGDFVILDHVRWMETWMMKEQLLSWITTVPALSPHNLISCSLFRGTKRVGDNLIHRRKEVVVFIRPLIQVVPVL